MRGCRVVTSPSVDACGPIDCAREGNALGTCACMCVFGNMNGAWLMNPPPLQGLAVDVSAPGQARQLADFAAQELGRVDIWY
mgnify:CR=1 FL=1